MKTICNCAVKLNVTPRQIPGEVGGGNWVNFFTGYVPLASQDPYPIIVYSRILISGTSKGNKDWFAKSKVASNVAK